MFEIFTPWIIVPKVNSLDDAHDDSEASVVTVDAARAVTFLVSRDHGRSWDEVKTVPAGRHAVDLTRWVKGTYGFHLKLKATGPAFAVLLRTLDIRTWVQVAPISLPRLKSGENRCRYDIGDRYGKPTMPMFIAPNVADVEDLRKYVLAVPEDYDPQRKTARIRGDVVLRLDAPAGSCIDWFTAGACFTTHQNEAARNTDNRIAFAVGKPEDYVEIHRADVPAWVNHWRYQWDQDVLLEKPATSVFVKYTGNPGVNVFRATVHLKRARPTQQAIRITHAYKIDGRLIERVVEMPEPGEYNVTVDGEPENVSIRLAVPSRQVSH